jgi:hypothetical protein
MNCPNCETSGAYTGLRTVQCQNLSCRHYDARYAAKIREEEANRIFDDIFLYEKAEKLILLRGEIGKDDVDDT